MSGNAGGGGTKAVLCVGGIITLAIIFYWIISQLNEVNGKVENLADRLTWPKTNPEDTAPIDVESKTLAETAAQSAIGTESRIHFENVNQSDQNRPKAIENQVLMTMPQSEIYSYHSLNVRSESLLELKHSEDFRTVCYQGKEYHLTLNQARVTERLLKAHQNKTPEVHQATLLENLEIYSKRVRDVFKNSPTWGTLIVKGEKKGTFRLNLG
jgi:hypothetical protein